MSEWEKFDNSTMVENYVRILQYINAQIDTVEHTGIMQAYIDYYIEYLDSEYKDRLFWIIPYGILKEKILDVSFGFGDPTSQDDIQLRNLIKYEINEELEYRNTICQCATIDRAKRSQCWQCEVRDCGCDAAPSCCGTY